MNKKKLMKRLLLTGLVTSMAFSMALAVNAANAKRGGKVSSVSDDSITIEAMKGAPADGETPPTKPADGETPPEKPADGQTPPEKPADGETPPAKPADGETPPAKPADDDKQPEKPADAPEKPADPETESRTFEINDDTKIVEKDGDEISYSDIDTDDMVTVEYSGDVALVITVEED